MDESLPNFRLFEICFVSDVFVDFFKDVSFFGNLHDDAECFRGVIEEGFLVIDYVGMRNGC